MDWLLAEQEQFSSAATGYAAFLELLQIVYTRVTKLAEEPAPIRFINLNTFWSLCSELPAVCSDISNAIQGFKKHGTTCVLQDEVLGLALPNFVRLLKKCPIPSGLSDNYVLEQQVANDP